MLSLKLSLLARKVINLTQYLVVGIEELVLSSAEQELLQQPAIAGVILFSRNYQSPQQLMQLTKSIKSLRPDIFIAVDQEGGRVQRFLDGFTRLPAYADIYQCYCQDQEKGQRMALAAAYVMAVELRQYFIDFSFAPVLDLDRGLNTVIADRSFSADPHVVTQLAKAFCQGQQLANMPAIGKHFPGHGGVAEDTHVAIAIDKRTRDVILQEDIYPFQQLITEGLLAGIMPAHVIYSEVDDNPAGFSQYWLRTILRQQLGFCGKIFSDDLNMQAVSFVGSISDAAAIALQAGCDYILVCRGLDNVWQVIENNGVAELTSGLDSVEDQFVCKEQHFSLQDDSKWHQCRSELELM